MSQESTLFKDFFNEHTVLDFGEKVKATHPNFELDSFVSEVKSELSSLELKGRVQLISRSLRKHLPEPYPKAQEVLLNTLGEALQTDENVTDYGFGYWPIAQFIEDHGVEELEASLKGMYEITKRFSAEFAIRPFLKKYPERMFDVLREWAKDENLHVRRLVSEGTRTRLPWGMRLHFLIEDPSPVIPLLEMLRDDPELYVRRSVANNLNDLTKDHPEMVLDLLEKWSEGASEGTQWIISHALRGLVKAGNARALALLGYGKPHVEIHDFEVSPEDIRLGEKLHIFFRLRSRSASSQNLMIDYIVHHVKANGSTSPKVFKLAKKTLAAHEEVVIEKKHHFKPVTTRVYYPGTHTIELQINGQIVAVRDFELTLPHE